MAKQLSAPSKALRKRTSAGNPKKYDACAKGGITLHKKWGRLYRAQMSAKGGLVLWLTRGSAYMAEIGRRGGIQSAIAKRPKD